MLSPALQRAVAKEELGDWVSKLPFLNTAANRESNVLVTEISLALIPRLFAAKEFIVRRGAMNDSLFLMFEGSASACAGWQLFKLGVYRTGAFAVQERKARIRYYNAAYLCQKLALKRHYRAVDAHERRKSVHLDNRIKRGSEKERDKNLFNLHKNFAFALRADGLAIDVRDDGFLEVSFQNIDLVVKREQISSRHCRARARMARTAARAEAEATVCRVCDDGTYCCNYDAVRADYVENRFKRNKWSGLELERCPTCAATAEPELHLSDPDSPKKAPAPN
ncbi:voltage-gated potassium channel [Aureococcus anophagefferens]|nr:voltage-gated potassium channel [Aureococcus anophagefferens]